MDATFGVLDAFAFVVFAVLIAVAVIAVVSLGQLPGRLARKWGHPQASAVSVAGWIGVATGGLLWPLALIWAFITPPGPAVSRTRDDPSARQRRPATHSFAQRFIREGEAAVIAFLVVTYCAVVLVLMRKPVSTRRKPPTTWPRRRNRSP
ncbi:DUF3302 domain-containing protein [Bradyrhizobium sp. HKCCYLS1011]|uniref:DUF3302 domain-containing protein n=1 Tax=Bradyrhizobium sp. HKCCYLS1011 TaxID=3420733 RepID=UPI003EC0D13E